jgi:DNA-3-methyladenine glycosylase I
MLEGFQAGLSWGIILRKRDGFRDASACFDPRNVAAFDASDIERMMANPNIVRARAKIEVTICGAQIFLKMHERGEDFGDYCWSFVAGSPIAATPPRRRRSCPSKRAPLRIQALSNLAQEGGSRT